MKRNIIVLTLVLVLNLVITLPCFAEMVMFNTKTNKYHSLNCQWAKKCTVNCIKVDKKDAIRQGGIPCKVCGG